MNKIRFVMLGGFLGAGKTTSIARLAKSYTDRGLRVAIVTNDQATDLVDTQLLRSQGFEVGEVAGACFCCNFNELTGRAEELAAKQPDLILAEPVGSCTDLVATVIQPLRQLYGNRFDVAPYGVLLKPSHGLKILRGDESVGFSPQAAYIFNKQLEEADFVALNRIDELAPEVIEELVTLVQRHYPGLPVVRMSARSGEGFDALLEFLDQRGNFGRRIVELDYDVYAAGEAELGWLNMSISVQAEKPLPMDQLLVDILERLRQSLAGRQAETAHIKAIGIHDQRYAVANLVSSDSQVLLSLPSQCEARELTLVLNARVAMDPADLEAEAKSCVEAACRAAGATCTIHQAQSFRPGRPVPTHRFAEPVN